ncbi:MAG: TolC family protein [Pirellulaceae bacterium]|nr:TolC family protein [Pirellulaceae bacterium]
MSTPIEKTDNQRPATTSLSPPAFLASGPKSPTIAATPLPPEPIRFTPVAESTPIIATETDTTQDIAATQPRLTPPGAPQQRSLPSYLQIEPDDAQAKTSAPSRKIANDDSRIDQANEVNNANNTENSTGQFTSRDVVIDSPAERVGLIPPPAPSLPMPVSHGPYARVLDPYRIRATEVPSQSQPLFVDPEAMFTAADAGANGGETFEMWWSLPMQNSLGLSPQTLPVDIGTLTETALASSPYVRSILTKSHIRHSDIVIADAEFDPKVFLEGKFTDTSEPVGSTLTTGNANDTFRDETFTATGGVRKKTRNGGKWELYQRGGFQSNNSQFLDPNPQGTTRLEFNFTQPLMRDRGAAVNNVRVLLAQLDLQISNASVRTDLETHLVDVTRAYWDLYQARADWLQRQRLVAGAERLTKVLEARDGVDSQKRQILRARAALTSRRSELVRSVTRIRDAQARLRLLTGSQQLMQAQQWELIPRDQPLSFPITVSTRQSVITALDNRSDIAQAIRNVQAVSAQVGAARNQVLPKLDMILGTYVAGLDDNRNTLGAWTNQLSDGRPTYWAGLVYELPVRNRANKARLNRNRWQFSQAMYQFQQATEVAFTEVEVAVRETQTAYSELVAKKRSIDAATQEVNYLQQRWELLPDPNQSAVLLIEDLLDAQQRLADEERALVSSQVAYALSWIELRKAMGILLRFDAQDQAPIVAPPNIGPLGVDPNDMSAANSGMDSVGTPRDGATTANPDQDLIWGREATLIQEAPPTESRR